jgi:outer membrane immunogenic protein
MIDGIDQQNGVQFMTCLTKIYAATLIIFKPLAGVATAGNIEEPVFEAPIIAPAPVLTSSDWTGFYTGLQLGYGDIDSNSGALDGNNELYGFHAGYDYDFGHFVMGAEFGFDKADINLGGGAANIDTIARLKFKRGCERGSTLIYVTSGAARSDTSVGNETGPFIGGPYYKVTDCYTIGAEVLEHRLCDVGGIGGNDLNATTVTIRAASGSERPYEKLLVPTDGHNQQDGTTGR